MFTRSAKEDPIDRPSGLRPRLRPGRLTLPVAALAVAAGAVAVAATATSAHAAGTTRAARAGGGVSAGAASPSVNGGTGWQGEFQYNVPAGTPSLFFHYSCPSGMIAQSGGFDNIGGAVVGADSPRWDSGYNQWQWYFSWPNGAPAGLSMSFDAYCVNGPA